MTESAMREVIMWIVGQGIVLLLFMLGAFGAIIIYIGKTSERVSALEAVSSANDGMSERLAKIEALSDIMLKKAARILHSPHTPILDGYLEKYYHNQMGDTDWRELLNLCDQEEHDLTNEKARRILAAFIAEHCRRRLHIPSPTFHKHEETTETV